VINGLDGFALDREIRAAGWHVFFMASGSEGDVLWVDQSEKGPGRIEANYGKGRSQNFNCIEVTGIVAKRFWGSPMLLSPHIHGTSSRAASSTTTDAGWPNIWDAGGVSQRMSAISSSS